MTLEEYTQLEQDFSTTETDIKTYLGIKGVSIYQYYYWKRKWRDLQESSSPMEGQSLPLNIISG